MDHLYLDKFLFYVTGVSVELEGSGYDYYEYEQSGYEYEEGVSTNIQSITGGSYGSSGYTSLTLYTGTFDNNQTEQGWMRLILKGK